MSTPRNVEIKKNLESEFLAFEKTFIWP